MRLQMAHAIFRDGTLIFDDPQRVPRDGAEVAVIFLWEFEKDVIPKIDPIQALRGRGRGEGSVEKLLQSRREDRELDERTRAYLCV